MKLNTISNRHLSTISSALNLLSLMVFLCLPGVPYVRQHGLIVYAIVLGFLLFIPAIIIRYYLYKEHKRRFVKNEVVYKPLPVVNKNMRIIWVTLNLLGFAAILFALILLPKSPLAYVVLAAGVLLSVVSNIFKYYAYKRDKDHQPKIVS